MPITTRKRLDANQLAASIVAQAVGDVPMPNQVKARAGRKGGAVGGKKRMDALTHEQKHKTLRVTPAMEAGIADRVWTIREICELVPEPVAAKRGPYKPRAALSIKQ